MKPEPLPPHRYIEIQLELPPRELSPNARPHYMAKARKTKKYRQTVAMLARLKRPERPWKNALVLTTWYFKTNRRRDRDNLLASMKSAFDGLADGGVVEDDAGFVHLPPVIKVDKEQPRVVITVERFDGLDSERN